MQRLSILLPLLGCCVLAMGAEPSIAPAEQVARMGRGVNIIGYDPLWSDPAQARFQDRHYRIIREAGFRTVRMNLNCLQRMDAALRMPDTWLAVLDHQVRTALANGLLIILDLHDFTTVAKDPDAFRPRVVAFWRQIAEHFQDAPDTVLFELLNEPNGQLTPARWNAWIPEILVAVRATNPRRTVIVGPARSNGIGALRELVLPASDRDLIVTVHYYHPMPFSHQGAPWSQRNKDLSGIPWGSAADRAAVVADLQVAADWSRINDRPILLGEFGAYDQDAAQVAMRADYVAHIARTAEGLGWAWTYWQFDSDFIVWDMARERWVEPIRQALIPGPPGAPR